MKRMREHQGRKYGVKLFIPSERLVDIAANRTDGMAAYFYSNASGDPTKSLTQLRTLVRGAYLQGLTDMANAIARDEVRR